MKISIVLCVFNEIRVITLHGRERIWATLVSALCVMPNLAGNSVTSGYPLYPSVLLMLDVPWRLEVEVASRLKNIVFDFAFYGPTTWDLPNLQVKGFLSWLLQWSTSRLQWPTALLLFSGFVILVHLAYRKKLYDAAASRVALIAIVGIAFFMLTAPSLRFGLAWLVLLPALWVAVMQPAFLKEVMSRLTWTRYVAIIGTSLLLAIWLSPNGMQKILYPALNAGEIDLEGNARINFVMPPPMVNMTVKYNENRHVMAVVPEQVEIHQGAGFIYYVNKGPCWNLPLPCGDGNMLELLQPTLGIAGGFVRKKPAQ